MNVHGIEVKGRVLDAETRCTHYHTPQDVIAIKFFCCETYYPCYQCHDEVADHPRLVWPQTDFHHLAVLCGVCGQELTVNEYLTSESTCVHCQSSFNPGCAKHYELYFEASPDE